MDELEGFRSRIQKNYTGQRVALRKSVGQESRETERVEGVWLDEKATGRSRTRNEIV
jgi:hypothetical protein